MAKNNFETTRQMHIDLIEAYKKASAKAWTQQEAYEKTVIQPAPRYYVSVKQAYQVLARMMRGDFELVDNMLPTKKEMYYSLFETVIRLSEKRAFIGKSLWSIMPYAINSPAPRFFISPERAKHIRCWLKNGVIREDGSIDETRLVSYKNTREKKAEIRKERRKWMLEKT